VYSYRRIGVLFFIVTEKGCIVSAILKIRRVIDAFYRYFLKIVHIFFASMGRDSFFLAGMETGRTYSCSQVWRGCRMLGETDNADLNAP